MTPLAAAVLASGELICEFSDGYRKSLLAEIAGEPPRTEMMLVYEAVKPGSAHVISTRRTGRHPVAVHAAGEHVHLVESDGPSVRMTTLTGCLRTRWRDDDEVCTRFSARHAWHFDGLARLRPDTAFARLPSGSAAGVCEPWKID